MTTTRRHARKINQSARKAALQGYSRRTRTLLALGMAAMSLLALETMRESVAASASTPLAPPAATSAAHDDSRIPLHNGIMSECSNEDGSAINPYAPFGAEFVVPCHWNAATQGTIGGFSYTLVDPGNDGWPTIVYDNDELLAMTPNDVPWWYESN